MLFIEPAVAETLYSLVKDLFHWDDTGLIDDPSQEHTKFQDVAGQLPKALDVSLPGQDQYKKDVYHWASSSSQRAACTIRPRTAEDVSKILKFIDKYRMPDGSRVPFGIKSGGHTANPGFSSTHGILISMERFNQVEYRPDSQTAVIGAGQIWDNVYEKLAPHKVTVLGARVTHIGVAGFILGGGYAWKTNQYGLAADTVIAFELVKPDGTIVDVTQASDPELFFALRGGGNNFGIITKFTLKAFPQGPVWGGTVLLNNVEADANVDKKIEKLFFAVQTFVDTVTDPKAAILVSLGSMYTWRLLNLVAFYDGPSPPPGIFDVFKEIAPEETANWKTQSYLDLVQNAMFYTGSRQARGAFHTVGLSTYTPKLLKAIWDESEYWRLDLAHKKTSRVLLTYSVEPFLPDILSHGSASAYPSDRSVAFSPFPIYTSWVERASDDEMREFTKKTTQRIEKAALDSGVKIGARYPNYAIVGTPLDEMYADNVEKLKKIKVRVDPSNVMGLAGGFKF